MKVRFVFILSLKVALDEKYHDRSLLRLGENRNTSSEFLTRFTGYWVPKNISSTKIETSLSDAAQTRTKNKYSCVLFTHNVRRGSHESKGSRHVAPPPVYLTRRSIVCSDRALLQRVKPTERENCKFLSTFF